MLRRQLRSLPLALLHSPSWQYLAPPVRSLPDAGAAVPLGDGAAGTAQQSSGPGARASVLSDGEVAESRDRQRVPACAEAGGQPRPSANWAQSERRKFTKACWLVWLS
jgi:hypothetical protein